MSFHHHLRALPLALAVGAVLFSVSGCKRQATAADPPPPPPEVTVALVGQRELVEWDEFTGRTEPVEYVELRSRAAGHIQEVRFQSGQLVQRGDVLFVIDARPQQAELARREADLAQARVRMQTAEREAARTAQLLANKAIATEEAEGRQARLAEAKAALLASEAARDTARLEIEYTQIRAPISGRVSRALVTAGNYVGGFAGMAAPLTTIVSVDPIYAVANVDENSLLKFNALVRAKKLETNARGQIPVELELTDESGFPHQGYLESFDNKLDPNTGSILLRAVFPNPDGRLVPGLFTRLRIPGSERHPVLLIDEKAIGTDQAQKFVLTLTPTNTVAYRPVKLGPALDGWRIVREGLRAGEKIVVNGLQRVRPGMAVTPQPAPAGPAGATVPPR